MKAFEAGTAEFIFYEDDFETFGYETDPMNEIRIRRDGNGSIACERKGSGKIRYLLEENNAAGK